LERNCFKNSLPYGGFPSAGGCAFGARVWLLVMGNKRKDYNELYTQLTTHGLRFILKTKKS